MSKQLEYIAKHIRTLILSVDTLGYNINDISDAYVNEEEELDDSNHPITKLSQTEYAIRMSTNAIVKTLVEDNILDPHFRKSLQKMATMDALKDGNTEFVEFVRKHIQD